MFTARLAKCEPAKSHLASESGRSEPALRRLKTTHIAQASRSALAIEHLEDDANYPLISHSILVLTAYGPLVPHTPEPLTKGTTRWPYR